MAEIRTQIVGAVHHEGAQTKLNRLRDGAEIELVREPDNGYDANAIACYRDGQMLGYIRARDNRQAAAAMDRGDVVRCAVHGFQPMVRLTWQGRASTSETPALGSLGGPSA